MNINKTKIAQSDDLTLEKRIQFSVNLRKSKREAILDRRRILLGTKAVRLGNQS